MSDAKIILDTNVVAYLMKGGPLAEAYVPHVQGKLLAIAFITVGEMYFGAEKANWGRKKRQNLETTLRNFVVIPYDHEIARCYGRLMAERKRNGQPIAPNDAWIAACAARHAVPLVTHNAKDFQGNSSLVVITAKEEFDQSQLHRAFRSSASLMEGFAEFANYLPLSFKTPNEQEYIAFLWNAFETIYPHVKYQLAFLAYHMLTASVFALTSVRFATGVRSLIEGTISRMRIN